MASVIFLLFFSWIGKLHTRLVGFEPTTLPSIPLLWKEELPCELELIGMMASRNWRDLSVSIFDSEQVWNAFEDSIGNLPLNANVKGSELQLETHNLSSTADQYLGFRDLEVCAFSSNIFQTVDLHLFILK